MLPIAPWNRENDWIVADFPVPAAPCRHVGTCIGPADSDASLIRCLEAIASAPHPVVVIAKCNQADSILLSQFTRPVHCQPGIQRSKPPVAIPPLKCPHLQFAFSYNIRVNLPFVQIFHHSWETVQAVGVNTCKAVLCENHSRGLCPVLSKPFLYKNPLKFIYHCLIGNPLHLHILLIL